MIVGKTKRPRNVDAPRAAAILYGDWGTSKAYVIGLAFAVAGYSSLWLILAMCVLMALVGVNYMAICRHYPDGGGVYASVRHRSEVVSMVGAFLLIANYIVTAALSALSAFQYLGWPYPEVFAACAILLIGALNFFGPKHSSGLALLISVPTVDRCYLSRLLHSSARRRGYPESATTAWWLAPQLEWIRIDRAGALWG
jgi:amino acid transporter